MSLKDNGAGFDYMGQEGDSLNIVINSAFSTNQHQMPHDHTAIDMVGI
jgi:hypothetical protein